jgi:hypothetical protein
MNANKYQFYKEKKEKPNLILLKTNQDQLIPHPQYIRRISH